MDEKTKEIVSEIETLKKVKASLQEEITKLQGIYNNLEAQAHTAQVKSEQDLKLQEAEIRTKYAIEENRLEARRIEIEGRISTAETLERNLNERVKQVELREQKLIDLEEKIADLNSQRSNFEQYKTSVEKELAEAKEIIAQADEAFAKIAIEKDMLVGREVKLKEQEKYWNDTIGKLEADIKKFQIEKENLLGLSKVKKDKK